MQKTQGRRYFIERGRQFGVRARAVRDGLPDGVQERRELIGGDRHAVHLNALFDAAKMGRCEQTGAVTGTAQDRCEHRRRGAFALAARNMNNAQTPLRIVQAFEQGAHPIEFEIGRLRHALLVIDAAEPEITGLLRGQRQGCRGRLHRAGSSWEWLPDANWRSQEELCAGGSKAMSSQ